MTLLEAIKTVLLENDNRMSIKKLTFVINEMESFSSKNGKPIPEWRIKAAARKHCATYVVHSDSIKL